MSDMAEQMAAQGVSHQGVREKIQPQLELFDQAPIDETQSPPKLPTLGTHQGRSARHG